MVIMVKIMVPPTRWRTMVAQDGSQLKMFAPGKTSESSLSPLFPSIFSTALLWIWRAIYYSYIVYGLVLFENDRKISTLMNDDVLFQLFSFGTSVPAEQFKIYSCLWLDSLPWNRLDQVLHHPDWNFFILFGYRNSTVTFHLCKLKTSAKHPGVFLLVNLYKCVGFSWSPFVTKKYMM